MNRRHAWAELGFDHIAGYLKDGLHSLRSRPDLTATTERISAQFAADILSASEPPLAVDVRNLREREQKHIAGSMSFPLNHLQEEFGKTAERSRPVGYCAVDIALPSLPACYKAADLKSAKLPGALLGGRPQNCRCNPNLTRLRHKNSAFGAEEFIFWSDADVYHGELTSHEEAR